MPGHPPGEVVCTVGNRRIVVEACHLQEALQRSSRAVCPCLPPKKHRVDPALHRERKVEPAELHRRVLHASREPGRQRYLGTQRSMDAPSIRPRSHKRLPVGRTIPWTTSAPKHRDSSGNELPSGKLHSSNEIEAANLINMFCLGKAP